jgi:ABC-type antimicrobial peptide transport system permease subunit
VVADIKHEATETESYPTMYVPQTYPSMAIVVRAQGAPLSLVSAVRSEIRRLDRAPLIYNVRTMDQVVGEALNQRRFTMRLLSIFAAVALTLAAVGLYGVVSYAISQRMNEIGIRMALGAQRGDVLRLVVGEGLRLALAGTLIGLGGALALMRLMKPLLFDVSVTDPLTFSLVALLLVLVTLIACWIPAQRATKVDPMIVLRCE